MRDSSCGDEPWEGVKSDYFAALSRTLCKHVLSSVSDVSSNCESIPMTSCSELCAREPPQIPIVKRELGVMVEKTIFAIAVSNAMHYEIQEHHLMFFFMHARHLSERCTAYVLQIAPSRCIIIPSCMFTTVQGFLCRKELHKEIVTVEVQNRTLTFTRKFIC